VRSDVLTPAAKRRAARCNGDATPDGFGDPPCVAGRIALRRYTQTGIFACTSYSIRSPSFGWDSHGASSRLSRARFSGFLDWHCGRCSAGARLPARRRCAGRACGVCLRGVLEVREDFLGRTFRMMVAAQLGASVWVLCAYEKKARRGIRTPASLIARVERRLAEARIIHTGGSE
jgi:hypothetical protein